MTGHRARFRGVRRGVDRNVTVVCSCGWVSQNHRSRGEAFRAYQGHQWLATHARTRAVYGTDAHRPKPV